MDDDCIWFAGAFVTANLKKLITMLYSSTRGEDKNRSFTDVLLNGLASMEDYMSQMFLHAHQSKIKSLSKLN